MKKTMFKQALHKVIDDTLDIKVFISRFKVGLA